MGKFNLFLQQVNFKEDILRNAKLKNVFVDHYTKSWRFVVALDKAPTIEGFKQFEESLKLYFTILGTIDEVHVDFQIVDQNSWHEDALAYYYWALDEIIAKRSSCLIYKNYNTTFVDGVFTIHVDSHKRTHEEALKPLRQIFKHYGFKADYKVVVDESIPKSDQKLQQKQSRRVSEVTIYKRQEREPAKTVSTPTYRRSIDDKLIVPIKNIPKSNHELDKYLNTQNDPNFTIEGVIIELEIRKLKTATLLIMTIADGDDAIVVKQFLNYERQIDQANQFTEGLSVKAQGRVTYDTYIRDVVLMANVVETGNMTLKKERKEASKEKRVELHLHTKMSNLDGITSVEDYVDQAIKWGHKAIAFTDHDGLYAYPDIYKHTKGKNIKPIYGVELTYIDETKFKLAFDDADINLKDATYVVFDLETTGLSYMRDKIIEISAVKVRNMVIVDRFNSYVNPEEKLSEFTINLTSITDEVLKDAPTIEQIFPTFLEFCKDSILVAHNAQFDMGHLYQKANDLNIEIERFPVIDTINIARYFYSGELKRFNLRAVAKYFKVRLQQHHRAEHDAQATAEVFIKMLSFLIKKGAVNHNDINKLIDLNESWKYGFGSHLTILVQNQTGYKNLFKLISRALTDNFYNEPRLTRNNLFTHKEGLLIGSACYKGEVFESALYKTDKELEEAMGLFDYIEVQPPNAYKHLHEDLGEDAEFIIKSTIRKIILKAQALNKMVVATGDTHYLNPEDKIYRDVYIRAKLVGGGLHDLAHYKEAPDAHFLTTDEMLKQFEFLGENLAYDIVIKNTNAIANRIERIEALPSSLYTLQDDAFKDNLGVESIKEEVTQIVYENAHKRYGKELHPVVSARIDKELKTIINNEYAPIYYISYLLVKKSLEDGYLVGSRGSVGSSLVATLMEITEVNPLKPHYRCKNGCLTAFEKSEEHIYELTEFEVKIQDDFKGISSGYDLERKTCPVCKSELVKDGQDIPFETFLGFTGDKIPDIDLNFSGDYQAVAHQYVRELLGENYAYRAGTIQTVASRNAYGYVLGYLEDKNITDIRNSQVKRLAKDVEGVKRSTGQHPGGIVVVPNHKEIFDVTPIQYPANDVTANWKTTHFDYHSFEDNLLKLDILGHDDPTVIKFLMDYVKAHPEDFPFDNAFDIPVDDKNVYALFEGTSSIGVSEKDLECEIASFGVPEFGTPFVRRMLNETKPNTYAGLVKISGLSHGTDVWVGNAQSLIAGDTEHGEVEFDQIIGCRDDIMVDLVEFGMSPERAFEIMEFVRRGHPAKYKAKWEEYASEMIRNKVPAWYVWSCSQIKYMFPKAHACAYVLMAVRIAWFKVYHPRLFYSAFFSIRSVQFEHDTMASGVNAVRNRIHEIEHKPLYEQTQKEVDLLTTLQVAYEMYLRKIKLLPVDIHKSDATVFTIEKEGLRMPFVTLDGLGRSVAEEIVIERNNKAFRSKQDVKDRTRINKTVFENMEKIGAFDDLDEEVDIFEQGLFAL